MKPSVPLIVPASDLFAGLTAMDNTIACRPLDAGRTGFAFHADLPHALVPCSGAENHRATRNTGHFPGMLTGSVTKRTMAHRAENRLRWTAISRILPRSSRMPV